MNARSTRARILTLLCQDHGIRITTDRGLVLEATDPLDVVVRARKVQIGSDSGVGFEAIVKVEAL